MILLKDTLKLPPPLKKPLNQAGMEISSKNHKTDKLMLPLLLDSTMDMLMMDTLPPLMLKSPRLLPFITITSVENIKSINKMTKKKFPESSMEDTRETVTEEVTLGFFPPEHWLTSSTEMLYTLKPKDPNSP